MASTPLLGLSLPADGTTNWGTLVNTSITALLDSAIAGTTTITVDADTTLTDTTEASNQARQIILLCSGARTGIRTITAPARSKTYVVVNNTSGGFPVKVVGSGPTTGVTIPNGQSFTIVWNGSDFVSTSVGGIIGVSNGGTGATSLTGIVIGNGTSPMTTVAAPSGTVVGTTDTQTLTNKRVTPRIVSITSAATITPTGDTADQYNVTALATTATIAAPSGTPTDGQKLILRIQDFGIAQTLNWTSTSGAYRQLGIALPTSTVANKVLYVGLIYNAQAVYWDVVSVLLQS